MKRLWHKTLSLLKGRDKGTVAVTFILVLPFLIGIVGMMVQYALLLNARLTVDRAAQAAARSAMTSLPTDPVIGDKGGPGYVQRSALMILESISPQSQEGTTGQAWLVADALAKVGANPPATYEQRFSYAEFATTVTIQPLDANGAFISTADYPRSPAPRARITITYEYQLTVPLVKEFVGRTATVAGINGRFIPITSTIDVQLSPGREAPTGGMGDP